MPDVISTQKRSDVMRSVRSKNSTLERVVRSELHKRGLRFRVHYPLIGKPDIVFVHPRVAVFIDSCFWHGCPEHLRMPQSNKSYWTHKIERNIKRDAEVNEAYKQTDWEILRFWEHEIKGNLIQCVNQIEEIVSDRKLTICSSKC
ncbi:MAG: mismatch endonuclease, patch repair protein [Acidobacteriota bacterium]|jgi:DNA mismatch endonuclease (patch repair protein)|nr:mismatch endonuclease, patch repair protein [Acidobacteriota bacterium]